MIRNETIIGEKVTETEEEIKSFQLIRPTQAHRYIGIA